MTPDIIAAACRQCMSRQPRKGLVIRALSSSFAALPTSAAAMTRQPSSPWPLDVQPGMQRTACTSCPECQRNDTRYRTSLSHRHTHSQLPRGQGTTGALKSPRKKSRDYMQLNDAQHRPNSVHPRSTQRKRGEEKKEKEQRKKNCCSATALSAHLDVNTPIIPPSCRPALRRPTQSCPPSSSHLPHRCRHPPHRQLPSLRTDSRIL